MISMYTCLFVILLVYLFLFLFFILKTSFRDFVEYIEFGIKENHTDDDELKKI